MLFSELEFARIAKKLEAFSNKGIQPRTGFQPPNSPTTFLVGAGCSRWTIGIVRHVLSEMIPTDQKINQLRARGWNLGMVVSSAVSHATSENFHWSKVCEILAIAGYNGVKEDHILALGIRHAGSLEQLGYARSGTNRQVKHIVVDLAKGSLWAEALSFLQSEQTQIEAVYRLVVSR